MALTLRPSTDDEVQGWLGIVSIGALIALYGTFIIANPGGYVAETARAAAERARSFLPLIVVATAAAGLVLARRGSVVLWFLAVLVVVGSIAFSLRFIAWERPRRRTDGSSPASAEPASSD